MKRSILNRENNGGFTLVELLVTAGILAFCIISIMQLFIYAGIEASLAGNKTQAISEAQNKIEEIRNHNFANIVANYGVGGTPGNIFNLSSLTGKGVVEIDNSNPELLVITVLVCWQDKGGRIIGEDANLDGVLDAGAGEDTDGDNKLDSPVTIVTMLTRR